MGGEWIKPSAFMSPDPFHSPCVNPYASKDRLLLAQSMSLSRPKEGWMVSLQALITLSMAERGFLGKSLQSLSTTCSISQSCHEPVSRSLRRFAGSSRIGARVDKPSLQSEEVQRASGNLQYRTFKADLLIVSKGKITQRLIRINDVCALSVNFGGKFRFLFLCAVSQLVPSRELDCIFPK